MHPNEQADYIAQIVTGGGSDSDDDDGGNFNPGARLDPGQIEQGYSPYPSTPGPLAPPPTSTTRAPGKPRPEPPRLKKPKDGIGYRWSELGKGIVDRAGSLFGGPKDAGDQHFRNFYSGPEDPNPPEVPVSNDQTGIRAGVYRADAQAASRFFAAPDVAYDPDQTKWRYASDDPVKTHAILKTVTDAIGRSGGEDVIRRAYAEAGIDLGSDLSDFQLARGQRVPIDKVRPGDLVGWGASYGGQFGQNVGIVLGNGFVLKQPTFGIEGQARVTDLDSLPKGSAYGVRVANPAHKMTPNERVGVDVVNGATDAIRRILGGVMGDISPRSSKGSTGTAGSKPRTRTTTTARRTPASDSQAARNAARSTAKAASRALGGLSGGKSKPRSSAKPKPKATKPKARSKPKPKSRSRKR
jgi:hypothetical protein